MFPEQNIQHDAIDLVVLAVKGQDSNLRFWLSVAINTALSLLVPRGIPTQIVMNDGIKLFLEVDPFRETVRRYQNASWRFCEFGDSFLTFRWRDQSCDRLDTEILLPLKFTSQGLNQVIGCRDEPAKDDRVETISQEFTSVLDKNP